MSREAAPSMQQLCGRGRQGVIRSAVGRTADMRPAYRKEGPLERILTFRSRRPDPSTGRSSISGVVKNPSAPLGRVASRLAKRFGIAGTYEIISRKRGLTLDPNTTLSQLPAEEDDFVLSPEYTPASRAG